MRVTLLLGTTSPKEALRALISLLHKRLRKHPDLVLQTKAGFQPVLVLHK